MIVSKYGKSYDTADGSEQRYKDPSRRRQRARRTAAERWEDDGGAFNAAPPPFGRELAQKPAWSVQSLDDLNASIRREQRANDPARHCLESARSDYRAAQARQRAADRAEAAARVRDDRYRNSWENT
jgi:hypothetical protein